MIRQFLKDASIYMIPGIVSRGLMFFLLPIYTRVLSPADYGMLDLFLIIGTLVNLSVALEINQGLSFYHAEAKEREEQRLYASSAFWFSVGCYSLFLSLTYLFAAPLAGLIVGDAAAAGYLRLAVVYMFFQGLFLFLQNQLRWELRSVDYAVSHITMTLVTTAGVLASAFYFKAGLTGMLYALIAGVVVASAISLMWLRKTLRPALSLAHLKQMLRYSAPLVPASMCVFLSLYIDRAMINYLMGLSDVGVYAAGARVAVMVGALLSAVNVALTPLILKHHREPQTPVHIAKIFHACFALALLMFLGITMFIDEIFWLMTTPEFFAARLVTPWLVASTLLANMYIFTPGVFLTKKTNIVMFINVAGVAVNVLLNLMLIPAFGIVGAGMATMSASLLTFLLYLYSNQKTYPLPLDIGSILITVAATISALILSAIVDHAPWEHVGVRCIILAAFIIIIFNLSFKRRLLIRPDWS